MKILFVIYGLGAGGAERVLTQLANHFSELGHDVIIATFSDKKPFYYINNSVQVINIIEREYKKNFFGKVSFLIGKIFLLRKLFIENKTDVVISFITMMNLFSIIAAKLAKQKIIVSEHTNYERDSKNFLGYFRRLIYPFANSLIILTEYDKKKYTFMKNKNVIKNPLILDNRHRDIERENIILGVGRLIELKGFDILIESFANLKTENWELIIVGEGPNKIELESLINKLDISNQVTLVGLKSDVELYYKKASIFVLSSRIEGFPGTLCESMGYGCPSIAFDCPTGPAEIIEDKVTGILVEAENKNNLTIEIKNLINNKEYRDSLSLNSKKILDELKIEKIADKWIKVMKEL